MRSTDRSLRRATVQEICSPIEMYPSLIILLELPMTLLRHQQ
jgi:hypothetical protein